MYAVSQTTSGSETAIQRSVAVEGACDQPRGEDEVEAVALLLRGAIVVAGES